MEAMNDEQKMLRTELCDRLMMNGKTGGVQSYRKKTHKTGRKISPNDPLRRRWTKMAFNLRLESLPS